MLTPANANETSAHLNLDNFKANQGNYNIVDVRNHGEVIEGQVFKTAISIPLPELRERIQEIPTDKPIIIHCAAGYRSAAATSIVNAKIKQVPVYDLGEVVTDFVEGIHE